MSLGDRQQLIEYIKDFKFVPGGRYLWYAGRKITIIITVVIIIQSY